MCFHLGVTKYPICLFFFALNIRFFTSSECFGSQLTLKIKGIHTQLGFFLCFSLNSLHLPHPFFLIYPQNHILPTEASFFFKHCLKKYVSQGKYRASCRCLPPLCKQWLKDKTHIFSSACSPHTSPVQ